jgi:hypothetical protein
MVSDESGDSPPADFQSSIEPDWDKICEREPARTDVPIFLAAREKKEEADLRLAAHLDDAQATLQKCITELLETVVEVHTKCSETMEAMEDEFKQTVVWNDEMRTKMETRLQEGAMAAQGLFAQLLTKITQGTMAAMSGGARAATASSFAFNPQQQNEEAQDPSTDTTQQVERY